ncbi:MAG: hypothetical protein LUO81_03180, partial [Methanoregulaceae archaeon]|nr:hypothetical protein [Methanoregulaceae archaeon]
RKAPATVFIFVYDETKSPVENAGIFLGNNPVGTTNTFGKATLENLTAGTYPLSVRHTGYLNQSFTLEVTDMAKEFNIQLEYDTANLTIATLGTDKKPIPATLISINGKDTGITDKDGVYTTKLRLNIPYTINATKEGYNTATVRTEITSSPPPVQTITMQKSMNWLFAGALIAIGAALILIVVMRRRTIGSHHPRHGKGGL